MDVTVVGQIARDLVLRVDDVPPPGNGTPVLRRRELLGGKGANQAVALAQLGVPVGLLGVVGDDETGRAMLAQARADGIDVSPCITRDGVATALIVDVLDRDGRRRYLEDIPEPTLLTAPDLEDVQDRLADARLVSVQMQQPQVAALAAARLARAAGRQVLLDGALPDRDWRPALLGSADVLRADAREAELLSGTTVTDVSAAVRAAYHLLDQGPWLVALAVAGLGDVFVWDERRRPGVSAGRPGDQPTGQVGELYLPNVATDVVDPTGAGDALVAGLIAGLLRGASPPEAARQAVAAAAATVGHAGGRPALTRTALDRQLAALDHQLATAAA